VTTYDERARASADRMLAPKSRGGKGQVVKLEGLSVGAYDTADATAVVTTATAVYGLGVEEAYSTSRIDGSLIRAGDTKFHLGTEKLTSAGASTGQRLTAPVVDQTLVTLADGSVWTVKNVERIAPAGLVAMYTLQLRNG
jgi:hypothetical protein